MCKRGAEPVAYVISRWRNDVTASAQWNFHVTDSARVQLLIGKRRRSPHRRRCRRCRSRLGCFFFL